MVELFFAKKTAPDKHEIERFNVKKDTKQVSFAYTPELTDDIPADACVRVLTNDGYRGSCSHLNIFQSPYNFAHDLRENLGWGRIPAIISGGRDDIEASVELVVGLAKALMENGFVVSLEPQHCDIGGAYSRTTRLRKDGVTVFRKKYGSTITEDTVELEFPKVE